MFFGLFCCERAFVILKMLMNKNEGKTKNDVFLRPFIVVDGGQYATTNLEHFAQLIDEVVCEVQ